MEPEKNRGKLKIFFSYAPGKRAVHAMLRAGCLAAEQGADAVAAVQAADDAQAAEYLGKLECLPPGRVTDEGRTGPEFDLDGAVRRRPLLLLLDRLHHRWRTRWANQVGTIIFWWWWQVGKVELSCWWRRQVCQRDGCFWREGERSSC